MVAVSLKTEQEVERGAGLEKVMWVNHVQESDCTIVWMWAISWTTTCLALLVPNYLHASCNILYSTWPETSAHPFHLGANILRFSAVKNEIFTRKHDSITASLGHRKWQSETKCKMLTVCLGIQYCNTSDLGAKRRETSTMDSNPEAFIKLATQNLLRHEYLGNSRSIQVKWWKWHHSESLPLRISWPSGKHTENGVERPGYGENT